MKPTKKSRRVNHNVYLETDYCILEIIRKNSTTIYLIDSDGKAEIMNDSSFFKPTQEAEHYYLDYLSTETLQKIDILTTVFDYNETINSFSQYLGKLSRYQWQEFSMELAYIFEDYKEILDQLFEFSQEVEYLEQKKEAKVFFDKYFYDRDTDLLAEDKLVIKSTINKFISNLEVLGSH